MGRSAGLLKLTVEEIFVAALMHDIGALSVEGKESLRRSALRDKKESKVDTHCIRGKALFQKEPWLQSSADIVRYHHKYLQEWDEPIDTPHCTEIADAGIVRPS